MTNLTTKKYIIAANWKMNLTNSAAQILAEGVLKIYSGKNKIILCPQSLHLSNIVNITKNSGISIGAQNCYFENYGAFTGENSPESLKDIGAEYVILGHSERRKHFAENPEQIYKKAQKAIEIGLIPIICIGESAEDRKNGNTKKIVEADFKNSVPQDLLDKIIIAYEPLWAIGTGLTPTIAEITEVHDLIKTLSFGKSPILYGGSANAKNCNEILSIPSVDGLLVGGASLKFEEFTAIMNA